jgi:hypothetical protein
MPMANRVTPSTGVKSTITGRDWPLLPPALKFGMTGREYPRIQPARQLELNQLNAIAEVMTNGWIGDILGAEKKGDIIERLK